MAPETTWIANAPLDLEALAAALRSADIDLAGYLAQLERLFASTDAEVRSFVDEPTRFARIHEDAAALAKRWPHPSERPPLYGVPIGVKDIFHVDGLPTSAGSRFPPSVLAGRQGTCITRLLDAGALILGKTVSTEFAYFAPGPTRNPRALDHTPGGSSSGSAAAVAAGLCSLALGTQTIGSVARPAAFCGVVGFKPSFGRIPTSGVIPLSPSLDHIGCFTLDVGGCALFASIACDDWRELADGPLPDRPRLGIPRGPYLSHLEPAARRSFEATTAALRDAGYTLREVDVFDDFDTIVARHRTIVAGDAARVHQHWFERHRNLYDSRTRDLIERGREVNDSELVAATSSRGRLRHQLTTAMDRAALDLLLTPSARGAAPRGLESTGDPVMSLPWTHAGLPTITIPSATSDDTGLPLGIQLVGHFEHDEELLSWAKLVAQEIEQ